MSAVFLPWQKLIWHGRISKDKSPVVPFHRITLQYSKLKIEIWIFAPIQQGTEKTWSCFALNTEHQYWTVTVQFRYWEPKSRSLPLKCGFSISYGIDQKYRPIWVSVSVLDLNKNSGFGPTLPSLIKKRWQRNSSIIPIWIPIGKAANHFIN